MRIMLASTVLLLSVSMLSAQNFVDAGDGVRLWYSDRGNGAPVVVIHGGPGMDHHSLEADLGPLNHHHRVIYYDQRGGGDSTLPGNDALLTIEHHVNDLEALRKQLGLEKMTLLAHSFGPAIAALYAIRYPERVERMVLLSPIPPRKGKFFEQYGAALSKRVTPGQRKQATALQESLGTVEHVNEVCRRYWAIMIPPRLARGTRSGVVKSDLCAAPAAALRFGTVHTNPATFSSLGDWNWTVKLAGVEAPTLIIHGEEDAIPMTMVSEWVTALPHARILRLPHTAHFPHAEQPDIVFRAIETFFAGRWPKGAATK